MSTGRLYDFSTDKCHAHPTYRYHTHSTDICQQPLKHTAIWKPKSPKRKEGKTILEENRNLRSQTTQKSGIKVTSTSVPVPPPTTPKLEKVTPYEFLQVWNSLKNVTEIQPYADLILLKQIPPKDLPLGKIFLKIF